MTPVSELARQLDTVYTVFAWTAAGLALAGALLAAAALGYLWRGRVEDRHDQARAGACLARIAAALDHQPPLGLVRSGRPSREPGDSIPGALRRRVAGLLLGPVVISVPARPEGRSKR